MTELEIATYLSRIKLDNCSPDLEGLIKVQEHHLENIPFENLDIIVGRKIELGYNHLYNKIILKNRGGYCFELNTLYAELLTSLGFVPKPVLGRVWLSNPKNLPPRNHLAYLVEIEGITYVTDVGFGGLVSRIPLEVHNSSPVIDEDGVVRVNPLGNHQYMIQRQNEEKWMNLYSFEDLEVSQEDIDISNYYMSTNPNSHFYYHKFAGRNTKDGRISLFNNKFSTRKGIKVMQSKRVDYGKEWLDIIEAEFSIPLDFTEKEIDNLLQQ